MSLSQTHSWNDCKNLTIANVVSGKVASQKINLHNLSINFDCWKTGQQISARCKTRLCLLSRSYRPRPCIKWYSCSKPGHSSGVKKSTLVNLIAINLALGLRASQWKRNWLTFVWGIQHPERKIIFMRREKREEILISGIFWNQEF